MPIPDNEKPITAHNANAILKDGLKIKIATNGKMYADKKTTVFTTMVVL